MYLSVFFKTIKKPVPRDLHRPLCAFACTLKHVARPAEDPLSLAVSNLTLVTNKKGTQFHEWHDASCLVPSVEAVRLHRVKKGTRGKGVLNKLSCHQDSPCIASGSFSTSFWSSASCPTPWWSWPTLVSTAWTWTRCTRAPFSRRTSWSTSRKTFGTFCSGMSLASTL